MSRRLFSGVEPAAKGNGGISIGEAIKLCLEKQAPLAHITVSSDSNGSMPVFDKKGNLTGLTIATEKSLLENFRFLVRKKILSLQDALNLFSANPAAFYKLNQKGEIKVGRDADIILFDKDYNLTDSFAMGKMMMSDKKLIAKGTFS